jgi:hypothetical protein
MLKHLPEPDNVVFSSLFLPTGGPSVSLVRTVGKMPIQFEMGLLSRHMGEGSGFVDCYERTLGVSRDVREIGAPTLCEHRAMLTESGIIFMLLTGIKADGLISEDKLQIIDFLVTCGAAAVYDACTLLCKGIVRVLKVAEFHELGSKLTPMPSRRDYATNAKRKID